MYSPLQADGFAAFARVSEMTKYINRADDLRALIHYWLRPSEFIGASDGAARRVPTELYTTGERRKKKKRAMLWNTWRSGNRCFLFFPLPFTPSCVCSFRSYLFSLFLSFCKKKMTIKEKPKLKKKTSACSSLLFGRLFLFFMFSSFFLCVWMCVRLWEMETVWSPIRKQESQRTKEHADPFLFFLQCTATSTPLQQQERKEKKNYQRKKKKEGNKNPSAVST